MQFVRCNNLDELQCSDMQRSISFRWQGGIGYSLQLPTVVLRYICMISLLGVSTCPNVICSQS
jgi:hypothetical protein